MVISVQEAGYVLGQIGANTASTPRVKSGCILKAELAVINMRKLFTKAYIDEILDDTPKGERNLTPTENQY